MASLGCDFLFPHLHLRNESRRSHLFPSFPVPVFQTLREMYVKIGSSRSGYHYWSFYNAAAYPDLSRRWLDFVRVQDQSGHLPRRRNPRAQKARDKNDNQSSIHACLMVSLQHQVPSRISPMSRKGLRITNRDTSYERRSWNGPRFPTSLLQPSLVP